MLEILYQDDDLVAINKPNGLLVHRTPIARNTDVFAVQELRNQLNCHVYPAHRLDRKTSGVLLFALKKEVLSSLQQQFANKKVQKTYWTILRGYTEVSGTIDYSLTNDKSVSQEALTHYKTLEHTEVPVPFGKYDTSRYSLVEASPVTGRMHQLRKHFAHILHPIIGDRPHGCNKQNKLFLEKWDMSNMLLHARTLQFVHPVLETTLTVKASLPAEFRRMIKVLQFSYSDTSPSPAGSSAS